MGFDDLGVRLARFRDARDWAQYHTPANLAASVSIEAAELLECFQWGKRPAREAVADEAADVLIYLVQLADTLEIDLVSAALEKIKKNEARFPTCDEGKRE